MSILSPVLRLVLGLVMLTVSLLLIGDLIGLMPDQRQAELEARKAIAESLAVQVSSDASRGLMDAVAKTITELQTRNDDLLSVALRTSGGRIVAQAGDHLAHWDATIEEYSTAAQIHVPIHSETGRWGTIELRFRSFDGFWKSLVSGESVLTIALFITIGGFSAYWLFLKRALSELDPSSVVPDRVRSALDALAEGLVIIDRSGRVVMANAAFQTALGKSSEQLVGSLLSAFHWQDESGLKRAKEQQLPWQYAIDHGEVASSQQLRLTSGGRSLTFAVNCSLIQEPSGALRGVIVTFDDLSDLEKTNVELERALTRLEETQREITRQNRELQVLATRDPLTGVMNRRSLFEGMSALISEAETNGEPFSAIMVDIDHFKSVNDRFGHATGDKVIKMLADILTNSVRTDDLVGRYGGEEFCVALPGVDESKAAEIAEQIRAAVCSGETIKFTSALQVSASFGVSCSDGDGLTPGALVDLADKALYVAKQSGRNCVRRWSQISDSESKEPTSETVGQELGDSRENAENTADRSARNNERVTLGDPVDPANAELAEKNEKLRDRIDELERALVKQLDGQSAAYDETTGLPTRLVLLDRTRQAIKRSARYGSGLAILSLEIDTIRLVASTRGTAAAEKLMNKVRNALHDTIRADDTMAVPVDDPGFSVSTVGNGEFVMLLTDLSDTECTTWIVQRVLKRLGAVFELDGDELVLDARIGVSLFPTDSEEPDELVAFSAAALREAKSGRDFGQFLFYNKTMNDRSQHQLSLKSQLFRALEREEFFLEYQPSIDIESGSVIGLEALLRWHQPERGLVSPVDFIPIAEHAGLIDELGEWVMRTALEELRQWHEQGFKNLRMAVNFSALQFRRADLPDRIKSVIAEKALPPSSLVVEITETTLIQNLDSAIEIVQELSDAGVRIALDDFGTGYSSLSYLQRFPIDLVKIDKSFLRDFPAKAHDTEIVSAVVSIAHNLGLRVVAEGVETERQFTVLRNLACDEIQGFLFSKPLSRDAVSALMANPSSIRRTLRHANPGEFQPLDGQNQALADVVSHARFG